MSSEESCRAASLLSLSAKLARIQADILAAADKAVDDLRTATSYEASADQVVAVIIDGAKEAVAAINGWDPGK